MNFDKIVERLSDIDSFKYLYHFTEKDMPMPSTEALSSIVENLKTILFPGFFGNAELKKSALKYHIGATLDITHKLLAEQIRCGLCFACSDKYPNCEGCEEEAVKLASSFIERLPLIKHLLSTDVVAAYNGDPASMSYGETIFCYPSILALTHYRIAHELLKLGVPLIPRIITELSHAETGIDIHPGASIDEFFFIDHGTGVVIGETTIIGKNVRLYQGVTLGAKSFPLDENGKPIKGIPRHPIVEEGVIIYSNATLLGRITIGKGAVIGGNMWITKDVKPGQKVLFNNNKEL